jgi:DNA-binding response OmpR family regulator
MSAKRLCLIEDDEIMGGPLALRLELEGYACDWFKTGRSALTALRKSTYDLVVSDILLPHTSGEAIYTTLLAEGAKLPPFIFMTGHGSVDQAVRLLKLGAVDYLTKPFEPDLLLAKAARAGSASATPMPTRMQMVPWHFASHAQHRGTAASLGSERHLCTDHRRVRCRQGNRRAAVAQVEPSRTPNPSSQSIAAAHAGSADGSGTVRL